MAGGRYVWDNQGKGWDTACGPEVWGWKIVHDTGAQVTAVVAKRDTIYAAWQFRDTAAGVYSYGIDTDYGGSWHRLSTPNLPTRYITSISLDAARDGHLYVSFGGYTDKWVPGSGKSHVFENGDGPHQLDRRHRFAARPADNLVGAVERLAGRRDRRRRLRSTGRHLVHTWDRSAERVRTAVGGRT